MHNPVTFVKNQNIKKYEDKLLELFEKVKPGFVKKHNLTLEDG